MMDKIGSIHKKRFIFLLLDNFSLISYACAVEPLRLANRYHSSDFYEWKSASENGKTAECSAGTNFQVDMGLEETNRGDTMDLLSTNGVRIVIPSWRYATTRCEI